LKSVPWEIMDKHDAVSEKNAAERLQSHNLQASSR